MLAFTEQQISWLMVTAKCEWDLKRVHDYLIAYGDYYYLDFLGLVMDEIHYRIENDF